MIYLYPANKTENLLALANKIQQVSPLPIFSKDVYIVQNAGMQHWLNMSLAKASGISFNHQYGLPAQFLWKLMRSLVLPEHMLDQDPFTREALTWRIYDLLACEEIIGDEDFTAVTSYWRGENNQADTLKRYQLSCQAADLYEQYLIYRPEWLSAWHNNNTPDEFLNEIQVPSDEKWQRKLWALLTKTQNYDPIELINHAISQLADKRAILPKRISFFGINAMAPMWLTFIEQVSKYTQVHFYHLNPCFDYWGDIQTEKQVLKHIEKWTENIAELNESVGNPLLANLGQQGREFLSLLTQFSTISIEAFDQVDGDSQQSASVLQAVQHDILTLTDKRLSPALKKDDSIVITSAHSALREVQGLHDWLLHQFNQDDSLTPKDVLVMCPQIEHYAPYVNAVFAQGWHELGNDVPPLPCSIADRVAKDSDPIVIAFSELLSLPDSRFQVNQIIAWLRLSPLQTRFNITANDIEKMIKWVERSAIHWGLDQQHKSQVLMNEQASVQFTWEYGFSRLLQGFAYGDSDELFDDKLLLADVEGQDAVLLGVLMEVIEKLKNFSRDFNNAKTPVDWHDLLTNMLSELFDENHDSINLISSAIDSLLEFTQQADFTEQIELSVVREFLTLHFSQPDPGRQFMIGQVTFCSMLPMRSIPFKIICILGLNDGEFPRVRMPFGFDLLAQTKPRIGDRSRRGDDRYLFLEALISARQALYLSYQGRNIKNNQPKQPSLVLNELLEYLHLGYGWQCFNDAVSDIRQLPMHPYSLQNYTTELASFDANWLKLAQSLLTNSQQVSENQSGEAIVVALDNDEHEILGENLIRFLMHPSRYFAQQQLNLYLDQESIELQDSEPFVADHLTKYLLKQNTLASLLAKQEMTEQDVIAYWQQRATLSGTFSDSATGVEDIEKLTADGHALYQFIQQQSAEAIVEFNLREQIRFSADEESQIATISHRISTLNGQLAVIRASTPKAKDYLNMFLSLSLLQQAQQNQDCEPDIKQLDSTQCFGYFFDSKSQKIITVSLADGELKRLQIFMQQYMAGLTKPLLTNAEFALAIANAKVFELPQFERLWQGDHNTTGIGKDPYIAYFWPQCPTISDFISDIDVVFGDIFSKFIVEKH